MIYAKLTGGLGNQLFQYAFCRWIQEKTNQEIVFDASNGTEYAEKTGDLRIDNVLNSLNIPTKGIQMCSNGESYNRINSIKICLAKFLCMIPRCVRKITKSNRVYHVMERAIQRVANKRGYFTTYDLYIPVTTNLDRKDYFVTGLFTSRRYFDDIRQLLINEITPKACLSTLNEEYLHKIKDTCSVCMHVRKGNSYILNKTLDICSKRYYEQAMEMIVRQDPEAVFYIFSNDFSWCEENLSLDKYKYEFVNVNGVKQAIFDLMLMKECKHFILSNSTFSWWAQYLCENDYKTVVSPSRWSNGKPELMTDLIENEWIKINA